MLSIFRCRRSARRCCTIVRAITGRWEEVTLYPYGVEEWLDTFRPLQLNELWSTLGAWATAPGRVLSQAVRERIELSADVAAGQMWRALSCAVRRSHNVLQLMLGEDGVIVIPTAHDLAAACATRRYRRKSRFAKRHWRSLASQAFARLPQINLPADRVDGCPVGLSLIAGPRGDERLLMLAEELSANAGSR